jgi:DNA-binding transcriptional LysR family regulator
LTPAGELFARHIGVVLHDVERLRAEFDAMEGLRAGHVELVTVDASGRPLTNGDGDNASALSEGDYWGFSLRC